MKIVCEHIFTIVFVTIMITGLAWLAYKYAWPIFEKKFDVKDIFGSTIDDDQIE
jgi:hypothetical protein